MTDRAKLLRIYVDANPFIYLVEGQDAVAAPIRELFARFRLKPGCAVTSELTLAEVLPRASVPQHRRNYLDFIVWGGVFDLRPVTRDILIETAAYRRVAARILSDGRQIIPKLPDAIHVVTAIRAGCRISCQPTRE
jgi:predicted nucleic acid-binding protein